MQGNAQEGLELIPVLQQLGCQQPSPLTFLEKLQVAELWKILMLLRAGM